MTESDRIHGWNHPSAGFSPCSPCVGSRRFSRSTWQPVAGAWLLAGAALFGSAGCGSRAGEGLVPVSGVVTLDGQPLARALVRFHPVGQTAGRGGSGLTDAEGRYTLLNVRGADPGIIPGEYRVSVSKRVLLDGGEIAPDDPRPAVEISTKESLPVAYNQESTTTLVATVPAGGGSFDFALQGRPPRK